MEFPSIIHIGGRTITISLVDNLERDHNCRGIWIGSENKINLERTLVRNVRGEILWHEIMEAITDIYGLKLKHKQTYVIAVAIHQILEDNKELFNAG
jgi:hypothetical protein